MQQHHKKSKGPTKRDKNDRYETPELETRVLIRELMRRYVIKGPVLEPAAGSGRMAREIRRLTGCHVRQEDIEETGKDFLKTKKRWFGDMFTNPPYHKKMPIEFVKKAHEVVDGRFAMLLQAGFLWTDGPNGRSQYLREGPLKPILVVVIPWRIYFYKRDGSRIKGQAYSHCWVVWPDRKNREYTKHNTEIIIAKKED